jgi:deoxyhypusine synthase
VLYSMCTDPGCKIVLTLSGALSIAKLDLIISDMIERGLIYCIVSTGAIVSHGFNAERGAPHFKVPRGVSDVWLYEHSYDRIYDTIELERSLDEVEQILGNILSNHPVDQPTCSCDLLRELGKSLVRQGPSRGIIQSAYSHNVPIFIPAFSDSEIGVDFAIYNYNQRRKNLPEIKFDSYMDFNRYCDLIKNAGTRGIITLGGGVPRNWGQQVCTYMDAIERRQKGVPSDDVRYKYGVRICPDPAYWGGLSGATYSEGVTWGKFMAPDEGGKVAEVHSDFTFVLPFLIKGLFQRLDKSGESRR